MELNKNQKKIARELLSRALEKECAAFLTHLENTLQQGKTGSSHELYLKVYEKVDDFDSVLQYRYDGLSGSRYLVAIAGLFCDGVLSEKEVEALGGDVLQWLIEWKKTVRKEEPDTEG